MLKEMWGSNEEEGTLNDSIIFCNHDAIKIHKIRGSTCLFYMDNLKQNEYVCLPYSTDPHLLVEF